MNNILVLEDPSSWPLLIPGVDVVAARDYLTDPRLSALRSARIYNLSKSYRYQSAGYYVSLLAEARGHRPLPSLTAIQDLKSQSLARIVAGDLDEMIQRSLAPLKGPRFTLSVYFGRNVAHTHDRLSKALFALFQAPLLRAEFVRREAEAVRESARGKSDNSTQYDFEHLGSAAQAAYQASQEAQPNTPKSESGTDSPQAGLPDASWKPALQPAGIWELRSISAISAGDVPDHHWLFLMDVAHAYFQTRRSAPARRARASRFDLAILHDPGEAEPPSDAKALQRFVRAGESVGFAVELIRRDDYDRVPEFDALLLRETTAVHHHTYRFARRAEAEGLVVIDDPISILRCCNKVYLAEMLERHHIPMPRTIIIHRGNVDTVAKAVGLPAILKRPDSAFSRGVIKVRTEEELRVGVEEFLRSSDLVIAQEFLPTEFDWRIGVFDRRPLFACRYFMAGGHWQIVKTGDSDGAREFGRVDTVPVEAVPRPVVKAALAAANLVGDGLYGVDVKHDGRQVAVIEVNDNPNIDAGGEDALLRDELYLRIVGGMLRRVEAAKAGWGGNGLRRPRTSATG